MLVELRVKELGVIADLGLVLGPGMIALTGETGAGKTLVVEAIELLLGGRADPVLVRHGAKEAVIEGRFSVPAPASAGTGPLSDDATDDGDELVLTRIIPVAGRSRAYVNGRMSPLSALDETAGPLVDLHGQHSHQSLLLPAAQRAGLDAFAQIDHGPLVNARRRVREVGEALSALGGDGASRAREHDMLAFQVKEIDAAQLSAPDEDDTLAEEEERLANARSHRDSAEHGIAALSGDGGLADTLGTTLTSLAGHPPLAKVHERLVAVAIELGDVGSELRSVAEGLEDDPLRLAWVRQRRELLHQLMRKYGDALADVTRYREWAGARLAELESYEQRAAALEQQRDHAVRDLAEAEAAVGGQRRAAAPKLAAAVQEQLRNLAMPKARIEVVVGEGPLGDDVTWLLGANPGEVARPLAKVASGGELARTMLAVRLVLGPSASEGAGATLVFDEVDAGIGGEAALAVGRALADLARRHQVLVVTHLPQVAAFADEQIAVYKEEVDGRTVASINRLDETQRIVELSRMLSGQPDSAAAQQHATELLSLAQRSTPTGHR